MKRTRIILMSDIHYGCGEFFGRQKDEIAELLCSDLEAEYKKDPYEALLLLGDYSLDHWAWNTKGTYLTLGISNAKRFADRYLPRLAPTGVEVRMIAGNHEQYGEALWNELTGHRRREHIVIGDILFILCDTYGGDLDPTDHSDGTYIGVQMDDIHELMARYPDKKVILCAHWFDIDAESEEFRELLRREDRILCLFCGHNHLSRIANTGEANGSKPIIYTGHYSYSGEKNRILCLPGYRELIIGEDGISSKYIIQPHTYKIGEVRFTAEYAEQDPIEIKY